MAKKLQAADLIGKSIVIGENIATIKVESAEGENLSCKFCKEGQADAPMPLTVAAIESKVAAGLWRILGTEQPTAGTESAEKTEGTEEPTIEKPKVRVVQPKGFAEKVEPKVEPKAKSEKPKAKPQTSNLKTQTSKYRNETYVREKDGKSKTLARIWGVTEQDDAYTQAIQLRASVSYAKDKDGNKQFYLSFGRRYVKAAEEVCKALNAGKPIAECIAIIERATEENEKKREEWKAKVAERNAQAENKPKADTKGEKTYTESYIADLLTRAANEEKAAMEEINRIMSKAA